MSTPRVAILGSGPSAAFSASACIDRGIKPKIISMSSKATVPSFGAVWFRSVPDFLMPSELQQDILVTSVGTEEEYMQKQWGIHHNGTHSSFPAEARIEQGYNPMTVLEQIWQHLEILGTGDTIGDEQIANIANHYDLVLLTFPTEKSKEANKDRFVKTPSVEITEPSFDCRTFGYEMAVDKLAIHSNHSVCVYDGRLETPIVRYSFLFGHRYVELVPDTLRYLEYLGVKHQVSYFNDIHPDVAPWDETDVPAPNVRLLGRYAKWSRKVLAHESYTETIKILESLK